MPSRLEFHNGRTFEEALAGFLKAANKKIAAKWNTADKHYAGEVFTEEGNRYIKVVYTLGGNRVPYCFIDKVTGNVLKAASWKAPETKNPRSCIFDTDFGASGVDGHGAKYLR